MTCETIILEVGKLLLQLAGALLIARLTVTWALKRYKSEKSWERKLAAFTDVVEALSDMKRVLGDWEDQERTKREPTQEYTEELSKRYVEAKKKINSAIAAAHLLLPLQTVERIASFERDLENARDATNWLDDIQGQWVIVDRLLTELIPIARKSLDTTG